MQDTRSSWETDSFLHIRDAHNFTFLALDWQNVLTASPGPVRIGLPIVYVFSSYYYRITILLYVWAKHTVASTGFFYVSVALM